MDRMLKHQLWESVEWCCCKNKSGYVNISYAYNYAHEGLIISASNMFE